MSVERKDAFLLRSSGMAELPKNVARKEREVQWLLFSCEFLPHFFVETRSWMRTWAGKPHSRPRREMVLLSGILSRNVGSVRVQSWTGGFSSTGGKRHIGEGKVIPSSLAQRASVGGTNGGRHADLRILVPFTAQTWSLLSCTVRLLFYITFPVLWCPFCMFSSVVLISSSLGQHPSENSKSESEILNSTGDGPLYNETLAVMKTS